MRSRREEEIGKIESFLKDNGIELEFCEEEDNYIDYHRSKIVIHSAQSLEHKIYTILHEIGHYFSEFNPEEVTHTTVVISEVLAWDLGRDIATTIGIEVDEDEWNTLMLDCIGKYINYQTI